LLDFVLDICVSVCEEERKKKWLSVLAVFSRFSQQFSQENEGNA